MAIITKIARPKRKVRAFGEEISLEAFLLVFVTSFSIGFLMSLMIWLFTVDYIFVVFQK